MIVLIIGLGLLLAGIYRSLNPVFLQHLKKNDHDLWLLIRGQNSGFLVFIDDISLFSWVLNRRYLHCKNEMTKQLGDHAFKRAEKARLMLISGLVLTTVGAISAFL